MVIERCPDATHQPVSELPQEPQVVLPEQADVVDRVLEHQHPLRAHPEREPGHLLRVVPAGRSTFGWTIPAPMISSQPVPFVSRSRFGSSFGQSMSTSIDGSVNGK